MTLERGAIALLATILLSIVPVGQASADGGSYDPFVKIVRPGGGSTFRGAVPYGAIRVNAFDRDVGRRSGAGIQQVVLTIRDARTGAIVSRKRERWAPFDFGVRLKEGRYTLNARAKATRGAGGTWSHRSIAVTVDDSGARLKKPRSVVVRHKAAAESLRAVNRTRANAGVGPVSLAPGMSDYAYYWSAEMVRTGFRHSSGGYAENIAWHSDRTMGPKRAARTFNRMWVNSSGHFANMIHPSHDKVGIGLFRNKRGWFATHVFG